ncbi:MAG: hypothetical protein D6780_06805 [Candidatus Dadabacteria bacterium]|nr:MAG: hypothetical protein D6780_06805 [Candidatus Dadabacteria bacterium]
MIDPGKLGDINGTAGTQFSPTKKKDDPAQVSKDEFITLLVTQLKNQDPLNPMENGEFAVKLAQFSQLEQLVQINKALSNNGANSINSFAAYLGKEVKLNSNTVEVENNSGGKIEFNLDRDVTALNVTLMKGEQIVETIELDGMSKGKHTLSLDNLKTSSGEYQVFVTASDKNQNIIEPQVNVVGVVSGFIPGPEPQLLVGSQQVNPQDIIEVRVPKDN